MSVAWVAVGVSVAGQVISADQQRDAARDARETSVANAQQLYDTAIRNNQIAGDVAAYNAGVTREVGYANAAAVERNRDRVAELMTREYEEELRRHIRGEKLLAGTIRSQFASSGFSVNEGTPLLYLHNELDEAERSREWVAERGRLTVFNYVMQETERAQLMRLSADLNAEAIVFNAEAEAEIYLNEAIAQGAAIQAQGSNTADQFDAGATASIIGAGATLANAVANHNEENQNRGGS